MKLKEVFLEIIEKLISGQKVDIPAYLNQYPQFAKELQSKIATFNLINKNFSEDLKIERLGEYTILQEIGRGGMGIVFLAIQPSLNRLSAVKALPPSSSLEKESIELFKKEAKMVAKFNHPNIVPIFTVGNESGIDYIAMGYVPGLPLRKLLDRFKSYNKVSGNEIYSLLNTSEVKEQQESAPEKQIGIKRDPAFWSLDFPHVIASLFAEIATALSCAHKNRIIHGDLKPSNIILSNDGIPVLVDFGLSKITLHEPSDTSDPFSGSLAYAAPEQIKEKDFSIKTDIWSFGATLYELLTFKNPFQSSSVKKTANNIAQASFIPPSIQNRKIPRELEAIVMKCLELDPTKRYDSMDTLAKDLNNYLESKPISAIRYSPIRKFGKAIKRKPLVAALIFLLLFILPPLTILGANFVIDRYAKKGDMLLYNYQTEEALLIYKRLHQLGRFYPYAKKQNVDSLFEIAAYYYDHGDLDKAKRVIDIIQNFDPFHYNSHAMLAHVFTFNGEYENAIKEFLWCYKAAPNDRELNLAVAMMLYRQGFDYKDMEKYGTYLITKGFPPEQLKTIRAAFEYLSHNKEKTGLEIDTNAKTLNGKQIPIQKAYISLSSELQKQGKFDQAIEMCNLELKNDPYSPSIFTDRGNCYGQKGDYEKSEDSYNKAIDDYTKAIELNPAFAYAYERRGITYLVMGEISKALSDLNESLRMSPRSYDSLYNRAIIFYNSKRYKEALADTDKMIQINPQYGQFRSIRALILFKLRKYAESKKEAEEARAQGFNSFHPQFIEDLNKIK